MYEETRIQIINTIWKINLLGEWGFKITYPSSGIMHAYE